MTAGSDGDAPGPVQSMEKLRARLGTIRNEAQRIAGSSRDARVARPAKYVVSIPDEALDASATADSPS